MDHNAKLDAPILRLISVPVHHASLDICGALNGVHDAGELNQHTFAHQLDDAPAMLSYPQIDEFFAMFSWVHEGPSSSASISRL